QFDETLAKLNGLFGRRAVPVAVALLLDERSEARAIGEVTEPVFREQPHCSGEAREISGRENHYRRTEQDRCHSVDCPRPQCPPGHSGRQKKDGPPQGGPPTTFSPAMPATNFPPGNPATGRVTVTHVPKPWGYEIIWAKTDQYVGKMLHVNAGEALSVQYHKLKDETVHLLSGEMIYWIK